MGTKQTRNKFRDMLGDYYKTNKEIEDNESNRDGYKGPINNRDKSMIIVVVILFLLLVTKSCFLDEVTNLNAKEQKFKNYVEYSVLEKYNGPMEKSGIMMYRVYDIYMVQEEQEVKFDYVEEETKKYVQVIQKGRYNARVRGYFLWVIPVKTFSVTAPTVG